MKIDVDKPLRRLDGSAFKRPEYDARGNLTGVADWDTCTVRNVLFKAVTDSVDTDGKLAPEQKMRLYRLAQRLIGATGEANFDVDELALLKGRAGQMFSQELYGMIADVIDMPPPPASPPVPSAEAAVHGQAILKDGTMVDAGLVAHAGVPDPSQ